MARTRSGSRRDPDFDPDTLAAQNDRLDAMLARASPPATGPSVLDDGREEPWVPEQAPDIEHATRRQRGQPRGDAVNEQGPPPLRLPTALQGATARPGALALIGMVVVVLIAAAIFGVRVLRAEAASQPVPLPAASSGSPTSRAGANSVAGTGGGAAQGSGAAAGTRGGGGATTAPGTASATSATVIVQVAGEVGKPGVVTLPGGSRVIDAVTRCGGPTREADLTSINLARPVVDGEQVIVVAKGAPRAMLAPGGSTASPTRGAGAANPGSTGGSAAGGGPGQGTPVDLNAADQATLETLPGVGPVLAQRILQWRAEHGRFTSVDELGEVSGVGEKTLERLTPLLRV